MQMSSFGAMQISIIPKKADPSTMELVIAAENRRDVIRMDLQKGEDVTMFSKRIQSMLRGLMNAESRIHQIAAAAKVEPEPVKSFKSAQREMIAAAPIKE